MPKYFVRVELHETEADRPSYTRLHAEMLARGFRHLIQDRHGVVRKFPSGTYVLVTTGSMQDVQREVAASVAAIPWSGNFGCVVVEALHLSLEGLRAANTSEKMQWLAQTPSLVEG